MTDSDPTSGVTWIGTRDEHLTYDTFGNVVQSIYREYQGNNTYAAQTVTLTGETGNDLRYLFQTQEYNAGTGTYQFNDREYDPLTGRFLQEDKIGWAGGQTNLYQLTHGDAVNYTDPSGMVGATN